MRRIMTGLLTASLILSSCESIERAGDGGGNDGNHATEVPDKDGFPVKGVVTADGMPLAGVVVSDGVNVTMTDFEGRYWLRSSEGEDVVWISIPSGYEAETSGGWDPQFWHRLDVKKISAGQVQRMDFALNSVDQSRFRLVAFADTHIRGARAPQGNGEVDSVIFRSTFIPRLKSMKKQDGVRTYAVMLGDLISEYAVTQNNTGLPEYRKCLRDVDFPIYHIPGNHDYEGYQYRTYGEEAREAKRYYIDNIGPTYYSFNIGDVHVVMLDGTQMTGGGKNMYVSRVTKRQYEWMKKDLARVEDKASKTLMICCHQPFYMYASGMAQGVGSIKKENRDSVMALTAAFPRVMILSGHQHYSDIYNCQNGASEVVQYTHTGVCGPSYRSQRCIDGSPCGLTLYDFDGGTCRRRMVATDEAMDSQVMFYTEGITTVSNPDLSCLLMNIPAYEEGWSVTVLENGIKVRDASRVVRTDPGYEKEHTDNGYPVQSSISPVRSSHIFEYVPVSSDARVKMTVRDKDGETYIHEVKLTNQQ